MATAAQITANQANAAQSTGPKTEAGKRRSSLNAFRHGWTSQQIVLPNEDIHAYNNFCVAWTKQFEPREILECQLVQTLTDTQWRLNRIRAQETYLLAAAHEQPDPENPDAPAQTTLEVALAEAEVVRRDTATLAMLSMREQRLHKLFLATLKQLQETQKARKEQELKELSAAHALSLHCKASNEPFNPKDFGFVLTNEDLDLFIWRLRTRRDAETAYRTPKTPTPPPTEL